MSTDQPRMESGRSGGKLTSLDVSVTLISCGSSEDSSNSEWTDRFSEFEVLEVMSPQPAIPSESTDVVIVDAVDADESLSSLFDEFHIEEFDEPIGVLVGSNAGAFTPPRSDIELVYGPLSDQEVVELVSRLYRRREYQLLLQQDFAVTHLLETIQSVDGQPQHYQKLESLTERKERLQASLRELQENFDNSDYQALFTAGFDAVA